MGVNKVVVGLQLGALSLLSAGVISNFLPKK